MSFFFGSFSYLLLAASFLSSYILFISLEAFFNIMPSGKESVGDTVIIFSIVVFFFASLALSAATSIIISIFDFASLM